MRVLVAGATGAIGSPLTRALVARGHEVFGMTRTAARGATIEQLGAWAIVCDALDREAVLAAVKAARPEVIVNELTALPSRVDPRRLRASLGPTNRLRIEGTRSLAEAAATLGVRRLVSQSIAFAYRPDPRGGTAEARLRVETDPLLDERPGPQGELVRAVRILEETTLGTGGVEGVVLRYGFFLGPGTSYAPDGAALEDVRRRRMPILGSGGGTWSFVHVEDAAEATALAIERGSPGVYNIVDDEPAPVREWLPALAARLGARPPLRLPRLLGRLLAGPHAVHLLCDLPGASNAKARRELGWAPRRSWREELASS